jgi:uncharacterized membrane protein
VSFDDWLLALHVLAAFALVGAMTIFWILVLAVRGTDRPARVVDLTPLMRLGSVAVIVGSAGTLIFGIWLAISLDAYHIWDGWVIAGAILWAIGSETGRRTDPEYARAFTRAKELQGAGADGPSAELAELCRPRTGLILHTISSVAILLVLLDMIWKPGA